MEVNVKKVMITILQGSVVTHTTLGGLTLYLSSSYILPTLYTCQKLWKSVESWQSYCNGKK